MFHPSAVHDLSNHRFAKCNVRQTLHQEHETIDRYLRKFGHPAPSPMRFAIDRSVLPGLTPGMAGKGKGRKILDSDRNGLNHKF